MRTKSQIPTGPAASQRNDVDLLSRIKRRDPAALGELYDRYGKLAYSIILRIVPDKQIAEDLLAETFVTVWNQIARWKDARIEDLRLWLMLLARHHAVEYQRSRNEQLPKSLPRPTSLIQPSVLQDFPRPRNTEQWARLRNAFGTLTDKESHILEMAAFDGLSATDIAINLGEPIMAVKETIDSALQKLSPAVTRVE